MKHGGDLARAEAAYGRPRQGWLDLSTGVNPHPYQLPPFPSSSLTRLPEPPDLESLLRTARQAYEWPEDVPVVAGPGAQAMIQLLPYLRVRGSVAVVGRTYEEHAYVWARAGHEVTICDMQTAEDSDVVVLVNPSTPFGRTTSPEKLQKLAERLAEREGLLVVDETYADVAPEVALGGRLSSRGVVVLRSFGKFFGLPGLRLGFAAGDQEMVSELAGELGPWPVSGPALVSGLTALADEAWIATMRLRLTVDAMRLDGVLAHAGFTGLSGCDLFRAGRHPRAAAVHESLARAGVWCRRFDDRPDCLRFGLPGDDEAFERLDTALKAAFEKAL